MPAIPRAHQGAPSPRAMNSAPVRFARTGLFRWWVLGVILRTRGAGGAYPSGDLGRRRLLVSRLIPGLRFPGALFPRMLVMRMTHREGQHRPRGFWGVYAQAAARALGRTAVGADAENGCTSARRRELSANLMLTVLRHGRPQWTLFCVSVLTALPRPDPAAGLFIVRQGTAGTGVRSGPIRPQRSEMAV